MHAIGTNESARSRQRDSTFYSNWIANRDRILSLNEDARTLSHDGILFVNAISISIRPIGRKFGYAANDATPQPNEVGRFAVLSTRSRKRSSAKRSDGRQPLRNDRLEKVAQSLPAINQPFNNTANALLSFHRSDLLILIMQISQTFLLPAPFSFSFFFFFFFFHSRSHLTICSTSFEKITNTT